MNKIASLRLPVAADSNWLALFQRLAPWAGAVTAALNGLGANSRGASGNPGSALSTLTVSGSGAAIAIAAQAHFVTGSGSLITINAPVGFTGALYLIALSSFTLEGGGNLVLGAPVTAIPNQLMVLYYDGARWYLSAP
ncbi:MAG TPA: hypothetical protein VKV28_04835 [Candidatus Binataceae bacterium]|nr:hypothetical protein [Candidatus Binataceae bacterium]